MSTKEALRQELRGRLRALSEAEKARQSEVICELILSQPRWMAAKNVLLFAPLPSEPDISPVVEMALSLGKEVYLPRYRTRTDDFELVQARKGDLTLPSGPFGVREPVGSRPGIASNQLDFILVPGVGFDHRGGRLGRGKGYYDRLLAGTRAARFGVAFAEQLVAEVPFEPHDVRMNCIVTPQGWVEVVPTPSVLE